MNSCNFYRPRDEHDARVQSPLNINTEEATSYEYVGVSEGKRWLFRRSWSVWVDRQREICVSTYRQWTPRRRRIAITFAS